MLFIFPNYNLDSSGRETNSIELTQWVLELTLLIAYRIYFIRVAWNFSYFLLFSFYCMLNFSIFLGIYYACFGNQLCFFFISAP